MDQRSESLPISLSSPKSSFPPHPWPQRGFFHIFQKRETTLQHSFPPRGRPGTPRGCSSHFASSTGNQGSQGSHYTALRDGTRGKSGQQATDMIRMANYSPYAPHYTHHPPAHSSSQPRPPLKSSYSPSVTPTYFSSLSITTSLISILLLQTIHSPLYFFPFFP